MPLLGVIYVGSLFVSGTGFALFLGIASSKTERRRERDLELREQLDQSAPAREGPPTS